ncbi:hypothetical protein ACFVIM_27405 [Streptomyces sp. NPDC057638]|uniref:hypothetical protein n=1 Tax=Streptomyces sp. NPDC057638 TaxID=3346190 RepID=UPI0036C22895
MTDAAESRRLPVSGRTYTRTRVRGFAPWRPRPRTVELVRQIESVLEEYREYGNLTARQIFYRMVGAFGYEKTEAGYDRLIETLNRARRARMIPMGAVRDEGPSSWPAGGYAGPEEFFDGLRLQARGYQHDLSDGQPVVVEVWVESQGAVAMVGAVAAGYGVSTYSSGGFESVTAKHDAALRIAGRARQTHVLSIGDHDPSGLSILDAAAADVLAFVPELGSCPAPRFTRLAVTPEQIRRYRLPSAPQKSTDRRGAHMPATVQAEALSPAQLVTEVRAGLEAAVDLDALAAARERSAAERAAVLRHLDRLPGQA